MNGYNEKGNFAFFLLHFNQVLGLLNGKDPDSSSKVYIVFCF